MKRDHDNADDVITTAIRRGFADLIEVLRARDDLVLFDIVEFGRELCNYIDSQRGYVGCETLRFHVVPNMYSNTTHIYDAKLPLMALPMKQWDTLLAIDEDLWKNHLEGSVHEDEHGSTVVAIVELSKKPPKKGTRRLEVTARLLWRPTISKLEAYPKLWERLCRERAAVAFLTMYRSLCIPRDVAKLIAKHIIATGDNEEWKIRPHWWF
jgi:hypothetical protein